MTAAVFPPNDGFSCLDATPAQIATRVASLAIAAQLVMTGDRLLDRHKAESIFVDLTDTAAWLAGKLANYHDDLDQATWMQAP